MEAERTAHLPVLVEEVRALLRPENGGLFVDGTVGLGGHARMLLERGATRLIGIDRDRDALARASEALAAFGDRVTLVHGDYREMDAVLDAQGIGMVDGILLDLGVSSMQLDAARLRPRSMPARTRGCGLKYRSTHESGSARGVACNLCKPSAASPNAPVT